MTQTEWLEIGFTNGWCSAPTCVTHEGLSFTEAEEFFDGVDDDTCLYGIRLFEQETA